MYIESPLWWSIWAGSVANCAINAEMLLSFSSTQQATLTMRRESFSKCFTLDRGVGRDRWEGIGTLENKKQK